MTKSEPTKATMSKHEQLGRVLVVNMGGTSTKLAIFSGNAAVHEENLTFTPQPGVKRITDELPAREEQVRSFLKVIGAKLNKFAAVIGRGGLLAPLSAGVYRIDKRMLEDLRAGKYGEHPSNLCALLVHELTKDTGVPAFIADPVVVDEFADVARVSGCPGIERVSRLHALNVRATCKRASAELGIAFSKAGFVVAHLGSGFTIACVKNGRIIDNADGMLGEGPFSVERAGVLPLRRVIELARRYDDAELTKLLVKKSGFAGYLGTSDLPEVLELVASGDKQAKLVYSAMVYQIAKNIGMYAVPLCGAHDAIIISGGLAHSAKLTGDIKKYIKWMGKVLVYPGENEMEALAAAANAALSGEERVRTYKG